MWSDTVNKNDMKLAQLTNKLHVIACTNINCSARQNAGKHHQGNKNNNTNRPAN